MVVSLLLLPLKAHLGLLGRVALLLLLLVTAENLPVGVRVPVMPEPVSGAEIRLGEHSLRTQVPVTPLAPHEQVLLLLLIVLLVKLLLLLVLINRIAVLIVHLLLYLLLPLRHLPLLHLLRVEPLEQLHLRLALLGDGLCLLRLEVVILLIDGLVV